MKRLLLLFIICFSLPVLAGSASGQIFQTVQINSSPNPVGSGARAQGMGGAFIGVADDATAASWNPGGLMQLERPEVSFVFSYAHRRKDFDSDPHPEAGGLYERHRDDLNYFSVAYPFMAFDKNMVISLNYQRLYDFYSALDFNFNYSGFMSDGSFFDAKTHTRYRQTGAIKAFSPAFAIQLTPQISVGVTFNFWTDELGYDNEWEINRTTSGTAVINTIFGSQLNWNLNSFYHEKNDNFEAFNMNFGFLWDITRILTIGAVFKTPFTADVDRETYTYSTAIPGGFPKPAVSPFLQRESIEIDFPMSYGLGIALRLSDQLTVAADIYRTHWSDFWVKSRAGSSSPITGNARRESHVKDTTQIRIGCEYLLVLEKTLVPLRFGAFYDPEPSEKHPEDFFGITLGTGAMLGNVIIDCAYIYRWGRDVNGAVIGIPSTKADVDQHELFISMIYHF
ncbi:MAG: hypothetical protein GY868_06360 [Deltaproteobacteria bacterium]|nr:hypothetical protein [Deltaproteobacteria bacterium]